MPETFEAFTAKLDRFAGELENDNLVQIATYVGDLGIKDADVAVADDLGGDNVFSGWEKAPIVFELKHLEPGAVLVRSEKMSRGPLRVATDGRHPGMSGPVQGPGLGGISKRTGKALRGRKQKKWNGSTAAKHTWTRAEDVIRRESPGRVQTRVTQAVKNSGLG